MKILATEKSEQNRAALDPWTLVHFSTGLALALMNVPRNAAVGAAIGYELVEQLVERRKWGQELFETSGPEGAGNAVIDLLVFAAGHWAGSRWNRTGER